MNSRSFISKNERIVEVVVKRTTDEGVFVVGNGFKQTVAAKDVLTLNEEQQELLSTDAFRSLWDVDRRDFANLKDCCRYLQQVTKTDFCPPISFFEDIVGDLSFRPLNRIDYQGAWARALFEERQTNKKEKGPRIEIGKHVFDFSAHAIERIFERFSIQKENFEELIVQILCESSAIVPPKKENDKNTVYLYHNDYHFSLVLRKLPKNPHKFIVVTAYEPNLRWRNSQKDSSFPADAMTEESA